MAHILPHALEIMSHLEEAKKAGRLGDFHKVGYELGQILDIFVNEQAPSLNIAKAVLMPHSQKYRKERSDYTMLKYFGLNVHQRIPTSEPMKQFVEGMFDGLHTSPEGLDGCLDDQSALDEKFLQAINQMDVEHPSRSFKALEKLSKLLVEALPQILEDCKGMNEAAKKLVVKALEELAQNPMAHILPHALEIMAHLEVAQKAGRSGDLFKVGYEFGQILDLILNDRNPTPSDVEKAPYDQGNAEMTKLALIPDPKKYSQKRTEEPLEKLLEDNLTADIGGKAYNLGLIFCLVLAASTLCFAATRIVRMLKSRQQSAPRRIGYTLV
eukprot:Filipodium_phascolosomae@DN3410_c0_g1_i1.p1